MSEKILCSRCAKKDGLDWYEEEAYLRLCTACQVENWVNKYGSGDVPSLASGDEHYEANEFHSRQAKRRLRASEIYKVQYRKKIQEIRAEAWEEAGRLEEAEELERQEAEEEANRPDTRTELEKADEELDRIMGVAEQREKAKSLYDTPPNEGIDILREIITETGEER